MNLNSRLFDSIRTRTRKAKSAAAPAPGCDHPGCAEPGSHRAPKGRGREGQFFNFCLDHVKEYNHSYNYFAGMTDDALARYQKEAQVGHRPTWSMGVKGPKRGDAAGSDFVFEDPHGVLHARFAGRAAPEPERRKPGLGPLARRAYDTLGVEEGADAATVKARYKLLVKQLHPDANGGDRSLEDRLREIIDAYTVLRAARLV